MSDLKTQELIRDDLEPKTAILSVFYKTPKFIELAQALAGRGVNLISSGGTYKALKAAGVPVEELGTIVMFPEPEILDGRVKTLHPEIHGGILAARSNPEHMETLKRLGIPRIDMVVVELYPFEKEADKPDVPFAQLREFIDIGGPTQIRGGGKNFDAVCVVSNPEQYQRIIEELNQREGKISFKTRAELMAEVFELTSRYDSRVAKEIRSWLSKGGADTPAGSKGKVAVKTTG